MSDSITLVKVSQVVVNRLATGRRPFGKIGIMMLRNIPRGPGLRWIVCDPEELAQPTGREDQQAVGQL